MTTQHITTKKKLKNIATIQSFIELVELAKLPKIDRDILRYIYVDEHNVNYIADILGYSAATIKRRHAAALKKIEKIIK